FPSGTLTFSVGLSAKSSQAVSFNFSTEDATARSGADYVKTFGRLTIPAGSLSTTVTVPIIADSLVERDELLHLNIDVPVNATIADGQGVGTILNDDARSILGTFDLTPSDATVVVGQRLTYQLTWTVPSDSWLDLKTIEIRIGEDGSLLRLLFDEA